MSLFSFISIYQSLFYYISVDREKQKGKNRLIEGEQ